jgi:hypothetical protein
MPSVASIQSEGDLEVVLLHETHSVLAELIGPELYSVGGTAPEQSVLFHTRSTFNLFLILAVEIFAEDPRSAYINQKYPNWSLLKWLRWFCGRYDCEAELSGLRSALSALETWADKEVSFSFWCPDVDKDICFLLKNEQLISFGANTAKHHLFRLADY